MKNLNDIIVNIRKIPNILINNGEIVETLDTYDFIEGLWISKISVVKNNKMFITNSNHFFELIKYNNCAGGQENGDFGNLNIEKRKPHMIYSRILKNYYKLLNNMDISIIEDTCIFLHNSFSSGNAGHDLFCILDILNNYKDLKNIKYIVFSEIENNNNYEIIKLFVQNDNLIKIEQNKVYNLKKQIIHREVSVHDPDNYIDIINNIIEKLKIKHENLSVEKKKILKDRKVILIKNTRQKRIIRPFDLCEANNLFNYLEDNGWIVINPEEMDFIELTYILLNAQLIIIGQNGISCANQIFLNLKARIIGFNVHNNNNLLLSNKSFIKLDKFCNGYYYDKMENAILSPRNITKENVEQFKLFNL